jgi:hypothetical protein
MLPEASHRVHNRKKSEARGERLQNALRVDPGINDETTFCAAFMNYKHNELSIEENNKAKNFFFIS